MPAGRRDGYALLCRPRFRWQRRSRSKLQVAIFPFHPRLVLRETILRLAPVLRFTSGRRGTSCSTRVHYDEPAKTTSAVSIRNSRWRTNHIDSLTLVLVIAEQKRGRTAGCCATSARDIADPKVHNKTSFLSATQCPEKTTFSGGVRHEFLGGFLQIHSISKCTTSSAHYV